jgi:hypothetical protein
MKLVVVGVLLAVVLMAGSAWADVNSIEAEINSYGLTSAKSENDTIITITNNGTDPLSKDASEVLNLGDITGLTIDWKANLTVAGGARPRKGVGMINFSGNGEFKLTEGTIEIVSADGWVDAIYASNGEPTVTIDGGTISSDRVQSTGINIGEDAQGTLILTNGSLNIPNGNMVFAKTMEVGATFSVLNGIAFIIDDMTATVYGQASTVTDSEVFFEKYDSDDLPSSISYVVNDDAEWTIDGVTGLPSEINVTIEVKKDSVMNLINNTHLEVKGTLIEDGTFNIDNTSSLTIKEGEISIGDGGELTNRGELINYGTINIKGTLENHGTLDNYGIVDPIDDISNKGRGVFNNYSNNSEEGYIGIKGEGKVTDMGKDVVDKLKNQKLGSVTEEGNARKSEVAKANVDEATIITLPVFKVEDVTSNAVITMTYTANNLNSIADKGYKIKDLIFVKLTENNGPVEFDRVNDPNNVKEGQFAVKESGSKTMPDLESAIKENTKYTFYFGIQDNDKFDWDTNPSSIVDPAGIAAKSRNDSGGGGGGCNTGAGYGLAGLLLLAGFVTRKYRKI